jgi:hypothetical protein
MRCEKHVRTKKRVASVCYFARDTARFFTGLSAGVTPRRAYLHTTTGRQILPEPSASFPSERGARHEPSSSRSNERGAGLEPSASGSSEREPLSLPERREPSQAQIGIGSNEREPLLPEREFLMLEPLLMKRPDVALSKVAVTIWSKRLSSEKLASMMDNTFSLCSDDEHLASCPPETHQAANAIHKVTTTAVIANHKVTITANGGVRLFLVRACVRTSRARSSPGCSPCETNR